MTTSHLGRVKIPVFYYVVVIVGTHVITEITVVHVCVGMKTLAPACV